MAKTVKPIAVELEIKGGEKMAALNKSFRDLSKQVKLSDIDIANAVKGIQDFANKAGSSEAVIKAQVKAFEGLREQAAMGGKVYLELGNQIKQLKADLRGSTDAVEEQRISLVKVGQAAKGSATDIQSVVIQLEQLQKSARPGSSAFAQLGKDIAALKAQLAEVNVEVKKFNASFETAQRPAMSLEKIQRQIGRLTEGLKTLNFTSNEFLDVQERIALLGQVQSRTTGRQQVIARERMFAGQAFETFAAGPAGRLELPKTVAALNLEISELQDRLANTVPGTTYANLTVEIANKQRELREIINGTADAYDRVAAAQDRSARVAEKVAGIQEYQATTGGLASGAGGYRDPATGAIIARGAGNIADRRAFNAARAELANAIVEGAIQQAQTLALPAAGQTTAPGTGAAMSGGAVPLRGTRGPLQPIVGVPTNLGTVGGRGGRRLPPAGIEIEINDRARRSYISQTAAVRENAEAKEKARKIEMAYRAEIRKAVAANNNSIQSHQRLRSAIEAYRNTLPQGSKKFELMTKRIRELDAQADKTSRRMSRRKMSAGQFAQAAGATISGGIFGGPEGFLGGAIGTAFGGPQGAFAGAAIGAQVGQLRQQVGLYTEMAAEIDRLRLGLAGASNDFAEFVKATRATEESSQRLLIPLSDSYRIMTQLRANTVELGISVEDTTKIFEGITASIYKTGGGLNEVQGAMRAVIQVLSKGAPQAEELRGQLGERLPAAIIDFAKFTQRTPEELADAFQKSEVTLDEFVDFAKNKYDENGRYLDELVDNVAYAGLRYQKALERFQLTTGRVFQVTGAAIQDFVADFLNGVDDLLKESVKLGLIEAGPNFLAAQVLAGEVSLEDLKRQLKEAEKLYTENALRFAQIGPVARFIFGTESGVDRYAREVESLKESIKILEKYEDQTKPRKLGDRPDLGDFSTQERFATAYLKAIEQRESAIAQARLQLERQAAQIREQAVERARQIEEDIAKQRLNKEREVEDLRRKLAETQADIIFGRQAASAIAGGADPEIFRVQKEIIKIAREQQNEKIELERQLLDEKTKVEKAIEEFKADTAKAILDANENHAKRIGEIQRQYAAATARIIEEGTGRAGKRLEIAGKIVAAEIKKGMAESAMGDLGVYVKDGTAFVREGIELNDQQRSTALNQFELYKKASKDIEKFMEELSEAPTTSALAAPAIDSISVGFSDLTVNVAAAADKLERIRNKIREISTDVSSAEGLKALQSIFAGVAAPLGAVRRQLSGEAQRQQGVLRLREEGFSSGAAERIFDIEQQAAKGLSLLPGMRQTALEAGFNPVDVDNLYAETSDNIRSAAEAARELAISIESIPVDIELRTSIADTREELRQLLEPANQIKGAADSIGTAFTDSFKSVIDGSATTQEALASFFRNVANYFLDMAAQIIKKMIYMAFLNTIVSLLPSSPSGGGGGGGEQSAAIKAGWPGNQNFAKGGVFGENGIVPYAMGGIVNKPTLFQYASGGSGRFGLMGEAGPEAIMPLRRTSSGRLGVEASGASMGNITVNVDAAGSSVEGDAGQAAQLGKAIGIAVQQELVKQKRPGGLLAS